MTASQDKPRSWFDRPLIDTLPWLTGEALLFGVILLLVGISRLFDLGVRAMSHDESLHVFYSWLFYQGQGYQHNPMMHGPLQFHLIAFIFFLFGDSNFTARLPHAIASILTVLMLWNWRRYLGRAGTMIAAGLMLISPMMLYYGRYARNEAFVGLFGVMTFYAILRYFETGKNRYLLLLTVATVLHFTSKETAFIYTAQALLFLAIYLINRVTRRTWKDTGAYNSFIIALVVAVVLMGVGIGVSLVSNGSLTLSSTQTAAPLAPGQAPSAIAQAGVSVTIVLFLISAAGFIAAGILLIIGYGWKNLLAERSFDMLVLLGTLVLPQLSALPVKLLGGDPLNYSFTWPVKSVGAFFGQDSVKTAIFLIALLAVSIAAGLIWDRKRWLVNAGIFYGIYVFFFTTVFTNWEGFFTGTVGSLGYWLAQQGVARGSQPWYYYILIQIPIYEFLPALGTILAIYLGLRRKTPAPIPGEAVNAEAAPNREALTPESPNLTFPLLTWWSLSSLVIFTLAGEKMPWLTFHLALPMILLSGWGLGQLIERIDWQEARTRRGVLAAVLLIVFFVSLGNVLISLAGSNPPFQGKLLSQIAGTETFLLWMIGLVGSAIGLVVLFSASNLRSVFRTATLAVFALLAMLTGRAAFRAAYVNYDQANEYLVYAHGASGVTDVIQQLVMISKQTAKGNNLVVGYDMGTDTQGVAWPLKWYLRDFPNAQPFTQAGPELSSDPVLIVDQSNAEAIKPVIANQYYEFNYIRMVWPNQDYFNLTGPRIWGALTNRQMRSAIIQIWLNRDFNEYSQATSSSDFTQAAWQPSAGMELLVRKDVAAQVWQYNIGQTAAAVSDPYQKGTISLTSDAVVGTPGQGDGQFSDPHGIAVAPDGSIYVADTNNNRIQHFSADGTFVNAWGSFADGSKGAAPLGTFNQPWDVAVSPDGEWVYVTDTWNHRIEKFTASGAPVATWGHALYGQADDPFGLWGPRGIAVDAQGRVYVSDTGNKRIIVYDADGGYVTQFGSAGMDPGQFDEPVGLALDAEGNLYVADTWNQRIQVFSPSPDGKSFTPSRQWDISGWYGESLENKPFISIDSQGHIFVSDPEMYRVLEFSTQGDFIRAWGDYGNDASSFGLASAVAADDHGRVWVTDAGNNRIMVFSLPNP